MVPIYLYNEKSKVLTPQMVELDDRSVDCKCEGKTHQFAVQSQECVCGKFKLSEVMK